MTHKLLTSSKAFDSRTGKARGLDYLLVRDNDQPILISSRSVTPEPSPRLDKKALKQWSARLPLDFVSAGERDMRESLQHNLHRTHQDQVQYIMTSEKLLSWLEKPELGLLVRQCQTAPQTQANAMSLSSAFLAQSLRQSHDSPVLHHSCGLRTEEGPRRADTSGTIAVINSLNSQLAHQLQNHTDLSFLGTNKYCGRSQTRLRPALKLLKRLVDEVSENESVFIIIDSLSRMSGDAEDEGQAIRCISRLVDRSAAPLVKVLLTDLLPDHTPQLSADGDELYVPDRVDVGGQGLNTEYLHEVSKASIGRFEARRRGGGSASDFGSSSEESASSDSDVDTSSDDSD
ncbi:hypothetical protein INS49_003412 [Diaporthe citri]|uniref:uncharacterized protein n=1 Tax=Diaporthe citri TaxID=83186 RepID=UPI001C7EE253|nr:uncharacterized protein INS49_003412 [Diaporthe citri]KAG6355450.1 hypothetical protein INS49_003412 [Diaporthe citri]